MRVWLVRDSDPLPIDGDDRRLMRSGLLAAALARRGHAVTWFTSDFDHYRKRHRSGAVGTHAVAENLSLVVLPGLGYPRNVSLARIRHNRDFARRFTRAADSLPRPDIVLADLPTTEAAAAAVRWAGAHDIPSVVSIRDLWPDFFLDFVPRWSRPLASLAIAPLAAQARTAAREATALLGISEGYLAWGQRRGEGRDTTYDRVFPLGYAARPPGDPAESAALLETAGIPPHKRLASFVGSWGATYDLELLAAAAQRLADTPDLQIVVTGDASAHPRLQERLAALPNVTLTGWLGADAIAALLSRSALGLSPYRPGAPQGLPNKVFEYMAYGPFQISTLAGETEHLLARTGTGATVPPADPQAFAAAIRAHLAIGSDPAARAARQAVFRSNYDAEQLYPALVDHIELVAREVAR